MASPPSKKRRAGKACNLCRIKKTRCDARKPCFRCVADNKLCVYTEKKPKKTVHPLGYIELLEMRVELLTALLETILRMAEPHLPFFAAMRTTARTKAVERTRIEFKPAFVPINDVVRYLISDLGLLESSPVGWEKGAHIASNMEPETIKDNCRDFAEHIVQPEADSDNESCALGSNQSAAELSLQEPSVQEISFLLYREFHSPKRAHLLPEAERVAMDRANQIGEVEEFAVFDAEIDSLDDAADTEDSFAPFNIHDFLNGQQERSYAYNTAFSTRNDFVLPLQESDLPKDLIMEASFEGEPIGAAISEAM